MFTEKFDGICLSFQMRQIVLGVEFHLGKKKNQVVKKFQVVNGVVGNKLCFVTFVSWKQVQKMSILRI